MLCRMHMELAGCYLVATDVPRAELSGREVHDSYLSLPKLERDFRQMKNGLPGGAAGVYAQAEPHAAACRQLPAASEAQPRDGAAFGTTEANPHAITLPDALAALSRPCLVEYRMDGETVLTRLPKPDRRQAEILPAPAVRLPKK